MLEISRNVTAAACKVALAVVLLVIAVGAFVEPAPEFYPVSDPGRWIMPALLAVPGVLLLAPNLRVLVHRRPVLFATADGLQFGGRPIVPWCDIRAIYDARAPVKGGFASRPNAIGIAFRHRRSVLRLPWSQRLGAILIGDVIVPTPTSEDVPGIVAAKLEALRMQACGHEDGAFPGASEVPVARIVAR